MDSEQAASTTARRQHGLITRAQTREIGISDDAVDWRLRNGLWQRVHRGVLRLPGAPSTGRQAIMAACLAVPGATASHRAAAALWEIPEIAARPEITVIDLSSILRPEQMEAVVTHILAKRRVPLSVLRGRLADLGTKGRKGAGVLAGMLEDRLDRTRHVESGTQRRLEKLVTQAARQGRLPTPHFEYPVQLSNGEWRFPDVGYPDQLTGVELYSYEHRATLAAFAKDLDRNLEFLAEDWFLIPVTDLHVRNEPDRLVDLIAKVLARREVRRVSRGTHG